jgi:hypothetical protein
MRNNVLKIDDMTISTRSAKITTPISYEKSDGKMSSIPTGPCLIEQIDAEKIDVVWGARGQNSTRLKTNEVESAAMKGSLVFLD